MFFSPNATFICQLTIGKSLSNKVAHFCYIFPNDAGGIEELTLMGAACQLTEEVHQIEEAGRTAVHRCRQCEIIEEIEQCVTYNIIKQVKI